MVRHDRRTLDAATAPAHAAPAEPTTLAGYRLLRRIASGERADVFLATVDRVAADAAAPLVVVRVYDVKAVGEAIAVEIEAMSTDVSGSLPELFDVATLADGRCALAVERLSGPSVARIIAERRLTAGEAVTLLAPIVVTLGELARLGFVHTRLSTVDVLLDGEGRPRLLGLGGLERLPTAAHERTSLLRSGHLALADLIDEVVAATERSEPLARVAQLLRDRLSARPFTPCEAEIERALFDAATPAPVDGVVLVAKPAGLPTRVTPPRDPLSPTDESEDAPARITDARRTAGRMLLELAQWPASLSRARGGSPDSDDGARRAPAPAGVAARLRASLRRRRPTLIVGGLIGGGLLAVLLTLVPPATTSGDRAAGGTTSESTSPSGAAGAGVDTGADQTTAVGAESPGDGTGDQTGAIPAPVDADAVVPAVQALLRRREECFDALDLSCLSEVVQPGSAAEAADSAAMAVARDGGEAPLPFDPSGTAIAAEMGSAVLVTVPYSEAEREPASLLVMRSEAGWRLREIFD